MKAAGRWKGWAWAGRAARGALLLAFLTFSLLAAAGEGLVEGVQSPDTIQWLAKNSSMTERYRSGLARFVVTYALFHYRTEWPVGAEDQEFWGAIASQALPPGWAEEQFAPLASAAQAWLAGGNAALPEVTIDLQPVKEHLLGPQGTLAALSLLQMLPPCLEGTQDFRYRENGLPECAPLQADRTAGAERTAAMLSRALPDSANLAQLYQEGYLDAQSMEELAHLQAAFIYAQESARMAARLALLMLSALLLASFHPAERLIKSGLAASVAAAALLVLEGSQVLPPAVIRLLARPFVAIELPAWENDLLTGILGSGSLQRVTFTAAGWALLASAGLILALAASALWQRKRSARVEPKTRPYRTIKRTYR